MQAILQDFSPANSSSTVSQPTAAPAPAPVLHDLEATLAWRTVVDAARRRIQLTLRPSAAVWDGITRSHARLCERIADGVQVYGVTTGFGEGAKRTVPADFQRLLQSNLLDYLDCGMGALVTEEVARATLLIRIVSLTQGLSAVSPGLVAQLLAVHNGGYAPAIPEQGSLGASGDLIPLAALGQCLRGVGQAYGPDGQLVPAREMLDDLDLAPFEFTGKDALGLINGTSLMTAIACFALDTFESVWEWTMCATSGLFTALRAHPSAFSELVNARAKTHPGQTRVAATIRELCDWRDFDFAPRREHGEHERSLQDAYSLRCTPQILGPCWEVLEHAKASVEREINSCNDNPLVDPETGAIASGGNFYGGSIAMAMDQLAWAGSHLADVLDRQILLAVHENTNRGLPSNLTGAARGSSGAEHLAHHGLKGLHQHANALTCEIVRLAVPASIFSRSSESHNQDKISLGTHAARNTRNQLELIKQLVTIHNVCAAQALELRDEALPVRLEAWHKLVRQHVPFVGPDVALRDALTSLCATIAAGSPRMAARA